jgi:hypothetical protein
VRQKARLPVALASLNNGHISDLHVCCASVRSSSRPSLVLVRPLCPHNAAWRSSLIANLNNIVPGRAPAIEAKARTVTGCYRVVATTLVCSFIWRYSSSMLSHCTNSFLGSPSLVSNPVRHRLSLRPSCLGVLARVSTAWLTT